MTYSTAEIAAEAQTTLKAIRLWEKAGLFGPVARNERGDRGFTEPQVRHARIIAAAQMAGMSLADIRRMNREEIWQRVDSALRFMNDARGLIFGEFDL